jgi:signal transduction histidine kinase/ligand-binding sensor domain-containing protein
MHSAFRRPVALVALALAAWPAAQALDPSRRVTQSIHRIWNQEDGLPQDTVRALAQTPDGYLWIGTDEGLARFDGYEFTPFGRRSGALPSNTVVDLAVANDGALWVSTPAGLVRYNDGVFQTLTQADGLPSSAIGSMTAEAALPNRARAGKIWVVAGDVVCQVVGGRASEADFEPAAARRNARVVRVAPDGALWVAGFRGIFRVVGKHARVVVPAAKLRGSMASALWIDKDGTAWVGLSDGLLVVAPGETAPRRYTTRDGLPDNYLRALWRDRHGALWAGTNGGLARLEHGRFAGVTGGANAEQDWVRSLFEDREGNLWVGTNTGLNSFHDGRFTLYSRLEGLPGDKPTVVHQDRSGAVWIGFHDRGLFRFRPAPNLRYTTANGMPSNEIFSIRDAADGSLLVGTREGAVAIKDGQIRALPLHDALHRRLVLDVLEARSGALWAASPGGLFRIEHGRGVHVAGGGPTGNDGMIALAESLDGSTWGASYGGELWEIRDGHVNHYGAAEGLPAEQFRSLGTGRDGTLWIGTVGGGLVWRRNGRFYHCGASEGLPADNIAIIVEDRAGNLWLGTTQGICHVTKESLNAFTAGRSRKIKAELLGVSDGLRSAQCAPAFASGSGELTSDGWLWFPTAQGLALLNPAAPTPDRLAPSLLISLAEFDGKPSASMQGNEFGPGDGRAIFRFTGIYLRAPEAVRYMFRLDGVDRDWVNGGARRTAGYSNLAPGRYLFHVRAEAGGRVSQAEYAFSVRPHYYQTIWFACLCGVALLGVLWGSWQLRIRRLRARFQIVLDERARLARELHDTLAQDFVGLSTLLDAASMRLAEDAASARQHLDLARKMVRHSLTEARRSVMDLRTAVLQGQSLGDALRSAAPLWVAGSKLKVSVDTEGEACKLPDKTEQHLLRVAQEALHNAAHHSQGRNVWVRLSYVRAGGTVQVKLAIRDDGQGFDPQGTFDPSAGHFGILGMRERAERIGGTFRLESYPGEGTLVEVCAPDPHSKKASTPVIAAVRSSGGNPIP